MSGGVAGKHGIVGRRWERLLYGFAGLASYVTGTTLVVDGGCDMGQQPYKPYGQDEDVMNLIRNDTCLVVRTYTEGQLQNESA